MESVKKLIIMWWQCFSHACTRFFPLFVLHAVLSGKWTHNWP